LVKFATILAATVLSIGVAAAADAKPKRAHHRQQRTAQATIVCTKFGCSDRRKAGHTVRRFALDANGNGVIVGRRPSGCPHEFCGCEASLYVFGRIRRQLNLASNWIRKFPRTAPAPGMAAARNHHVMVLISHVDGSDWLVHDGNSGGGLTRNHVMSIRGYTVVDPRGARSAQR
jgi:hypothetical protein